MVVVFWLEGDSMTGILLMHKIREHQVCHLDPCLLSGECEGRFALKSNGSAYRRALFRLERGVCVKCRLDCHALVKRLQVPGLRMRGL